MREYPTYLRPTCEFLSSYELDERARFISFRLRNRDFKLELFKLNYVFEFPKDHEANVQFNTNEIWRELTGDQHVIYEARTCRESKIHSHALRYVHCVMAHTIFGRREWDSVIPNTKLQVLYYMVHERKIYLCHAIALKLKDVVQSFNMAITIGHLVTIFVHYVSSIYMICHLRKLRGEIRLTLS